MKKVLSILLLAGICNFSFAQSPYSTANPVKENPDYTSQPNRSDRGYDKTVSASSTYDYNNQHNRSADNEGIYRNREDRRGTGSRGYEERKYDRKSESFPDRHNKGGRYPEKRNPQNNTIKAFGGGLILGGIIGVLIASSK